MNKIFNEDILLGIDKIKNDERGILIITHYYRILYYIKPDVASIMIDGRIVKTGGKELAEEIEKNGFDNIINEVELSQNV